MPKVATTMVKEIFSDWGRGKTWEKVRISKLSLQKISAKNVDILEQNKQNTMQVLTLSQKIIKFVKTIQYIISYTFHSVSHITWVIGDILSSSKSVCGHFLSFLMSKDNVALLETFMNDHALLVQSKITPTKFNFTYKTYIQCKLLSLESWKRCGKRGGSFS